MLLLALSGEMGGGVARYTRDMKAGVYSQPHPRLSTDRGPPPLESLDKAGIQSRATVTMFPHTYVSP